MSRKNVLAACTAAWSALGLNAVANAVPGGDAGFYIGASANWVSVDDRDIDDDDSTFGARAGYNFNDFFGIEGGYIDLGDHSSLPASFDASAWYGAGQLNIPIAIIDLYGKAGLAYVDSELSLLDSNEKADSFEPYFGFGIELDLGVLNFFGEAARVDTDVGVDVDIYSLGIKLEF